MSDIFVWFPTIKTGTGTDTFTTRLAEGLAARGIRTEISWLPHRAEYLPGSVPIPPKPPEANIIHINTWLPARFIRPFKETPVVATIHHGNYAPAAFQSKSMLQKIYNHLWIRPIEQKNAKRADTLTAVSQHAANTFRTHVLDTDICVIHNGIDTNEFCPQPTYPTPPDHQFRLLYIGGWKRMKGISTLSRVMQELRSNFTLYYTGPEGKTNAQNGMPENCVNLGRLTTQAEVINAYRSCDAFIFPSLSEGFGLVVVEAMACGKPVVVSNLPSLEEIARNNIDGIVCDKDSPHDFAAAIIRLAQSKDQAHAMGKEGQLRAVSFFSYEKMLSNYINTYSKLCKSYTIQKNFSKPKINLA
jgi:glycosyltransferase involved in cell wall biosynthesis